MYLCVNKINTRYFENRLLESLHSADTQNTKTNVNVLVVLVCDEGEEKGLAALLLQVGHQPGRLVAPLHTGVRLHQVRLPQDDVVQQDHVLGYHQSG